MKRLLKISSLFPLLLALFLFNADAQKPFFGKTFLKPPTILVKTGNSAAAQNLSVLSPAPGDTSFYQFKPIVGLAYSFPNYQAQAVAGISYQHVRKYKYQTATEPAEIDIDWSINLLYSGGLTTVPSNIDGNISSIGLGLGLLNNTVVICGLVNSYKNKDDPNASTKLRPVVAIMYAF